MNVPIVLHGHCHDCMASNVYSKGSGKTRILCSGALKDYDAASFTLSHVGDIWKLEKQELFDCQFFVQD